MITVWNIDSPYTTITLPVAGIGIYLAVDWGDGSEIQLVTSDFPTHYYANMGEYEISISGKCPIFGYNLGTEVGSDSPYYSMTKYLIGIRKFGELEATKYGFEYCRNLRYVSEDNTTANSFYYTTDMSHMFRYCSNLSSIDVSKWDVSNVTNMNRMFSTCSNIKTLDVSKWDVGNVTNMESMFYMCTNINELDVSTWNTSKVTTMHTMFSAEVGSYMNLISLDVSNWDTHNVVDMCGMFQMCNKLTYLDVSKWNVSNVQDFSYIFTCVNSLTNAVGTSSLTQLDVSRWDTRSARNMRAMFQGCARLRNLNLSNFNTNNVTDMSFMFSLCSNLTSLDISSFNTSRVINMERMFQNCTYLRTIIVRSPFGSSANKSNYLLNCSASFSYR